MRRLLFRREIRWLRRRHLPLYKMTSSSWVWACRWEPKFPETVAALLHSCLSTQILLLPEILRTVQTRKRLKKPHKQPTAIANLKQWLCASGVAHSVTMIASAQLSSALPVLFHELHFPHISIFCSYFFLSCKKKKKKKIGRHLIQYSVANTIHSFPLLLCGFHSSFVQWMEFRSLVILTNYFESLYGGNSFKVYYLHIWAFTNDFV